LPASPPSDKNSADNRRVEPKWQKREVIILVAILILSGLIRMVRLAEPNSVVFDETYYAKDACLYLGHTQAFCGIKQATEQSYVHPPLGKWLIALGIKIFGYNSFGWRFSAAVAGIVLTGLVYVLARKLFRDRWVAAVAGLLTATDFLLIVQSRIAMLDIFLALFIVLAFVLLVLDRSALRKVKERLESSTSVEVSNAKGHAETITMTRRLPARRYFWRMLAGASFGLALAVKWSAVWALAAGGVMAMAWSVELALASRRQTESEFFGPSVSGRKELVKEIAVSFVAFLLLPIIVYLSAYSVFFVDQARQECPYTVPARATDRLFSGGFAGYREGQCIRGIEGVVLNWGDLQQRVLNYHLTLKAKHTYQSKAWSWPLVLRPVAYYYEAPKGNSSEILALGNVVTWYGALAALVWLIVRSLRSWRPERFILVAWQTQYLPWLVVARPLFLFYMTPAVPFMMVALAAGLNALRTKNRLANRLVLAYLILGVGVMLVYFYPIIAAVSVPQSIWQGHMWVPLHDCGGFKCGWI